MSDWIEWNGGDMPVAEGTPVQVRLRYGKENYALAGSGYATRWTYGGPQDGFDDILAYRIAEQPDDAAGFRMLILSEDEIIRRLDAEEQAYSKLSGKFRHYCREWDGMAIDESCDEFSCCSCFEEVVTQ